MIEEIKKVLKSGMFVNGEQVRLLEQEVSQKHKVKYGIAVSSGTDALYLSLRVLGIGQGDEVITTPFTFIATAEVICRVGAKPVFVDIDETRNIDVLKIENVITPRTRAIIPVHLFGRLCNMAVILSLAKKYHLKVIEDACQAFGTLGVGQANTACISFYPTKILGACGDAGMIITNNKKLAERLRRLRNHGSSPKQKYRHLELGVNSRMDEIQAVILRKKLKTFEKDKLNFKFREGVYYPIPLHLQPAFKFLGYKKGDFPRAELEARKIKNYGKKNI